jgi:alkaline phosphatase D
VPSSRREFLRTTARALGAAFVWAGDPRLPGTRGPWSERRDLYTEGVASGDPGPDSVILWTRASFGAEGVTVPLTVEVAEDAAFRSVIARAGAPALNAADHTCRVLVGGLRPARTYFYRFSDPEGRGSRLGRTRTAPEPGDPRPVRFAFVSCQNPCEGALNAYRRMIHEDERAQEPEQLAFVLHLGDFIYEVVDYPEDRPTGRRYDRRLRYLVQFPQGEKVAGFHVPVTLEDYRTVYRAYLKDPDLQDARARWPFVPIWDNHEFSWNGWQSFQRFEGKTRPAQTRKAAANQAWFEYQPARVAGPGGAALERFDAPSVKDAAIEQFDDHGLGLEPNNLAAIRSLTAYRSFRWGRHLDLIITDQHSNRSEEPTSRPQAEALTSEDFPELWPEEAVKILDAGKAYGGGRPPDRIRIGTVDIPNFRKDGPPQTLLGAEQKRWFLERLRTSKATWKVWGNSAGTLDWRADPQSLPPGTGRPWPGSGYACFGGGGDYGTAYTERAEIYDAVRDASVTGFVTASGDRHSFWAGLAAKTLPPARFDPVGVAFVTGSISAPGLVEAYEHRFPKDHPLRPLYVADRAGSMHPAVNLLLHHGVRACLEYQRTGDAEAARRASNPDLSPHLSFVDMGGHGYATLRLSAETVECEFVCIPRPFERSPDPDGGPLRYRVRHIARAWRPGDKPRLERLVVEGDPSLAL